MAYDPDLQPIFDDFEKRILALEGRESAPPVEPEPEVVSPIWETAQLPTVHADDEVFAPSGQNIVWVPVSVDQTDAGTVLLRVNRAQNAKPATINVGRNQAAYLPKEIYRWSPGDDLVHYVRLQLPGTSYSDGKQIKFHFEIIGARNSSQVVLVTFKDGASHPEMLPQRHRPARKLDLSKAVRANVFDPAKLKHSDSGFDKDGKPCWRSRLSHGYSQVGNGETGLYMNEDKFSDMAQDPITYDAQENAIRLHTFAAPDDAPLIFDGRVFKHQAAIIQGQTIDDVCGVEGAWQIIAKSPTRQYSWPAFWLLGRGKNGAQGGHTQWPPEIDIMEQFNRSWGAAYTPFTTSCGQHYGDAGSNSRKGNRGYIIETDEILGATAANDEAYHEYSGTVVWKGDQAEVTFFFDGEEVATQVLLARHQDMKTRLPFYPIANVAVRALSDSNADSYNNDPRSGDMLIKDIGYYPSGFSF